MTSRHELETSCFEVFLIEFGRCFWWSMCSWISGPTTSKSVGALAWSEQPMFSSAKLQDFFENLVERSTETIPLSGSYMEKVPLNKGFTTSCFQVRSSIFLSEIGRELHRNSTFKRKLYGKNAIVKRLRNFLLDPLIARHLKTEAPCVFEGHFVLVGSSTCLFW